MFTDSRSRASVFTPIEKGVSKRWTGMTFDLLRTITPPSALPEGTTAISATYARARSKQGPQARSRPTLSRYVCQHEGKSPHS